MNFVAIILKAAKAAQVSGTLLLAICGHESMDFTLNYSANDKGTPSYGVCQVKEGTARMLGYKGPAKDLNKPELSAKYAGMYLKYQIERYGDQDWCVLAAAYNAGSYNESHKLPGYPRNLKYVRLVQQKLEKDLQPKLSCGKTENTELAYIRQ
jgi:soluble lytic murein transglycosylase-like protein